MSPERPVARMTLRQLLTHAGRLTRDAHELADKTFRTRLSDLHELSRPTRRKSQYPTVVSLQNALKRFDDTSRELLTILDSLDEHFQAIRELARRARQERPG